MKQLKAREAAINDELERLGRDLQRGEEHFNECRAEFDREKWVQHILVALNSNSNNYYFEWPGVYWAMRSRIALNLKRKFALYSKPLTK